MKTNSWLSKSKQTADLMAPFEYQYLLIPISKYQMNPFEYQIVAFEY